MKNFGILFLFLFFSQIALSQSRDTATSYSFSIKQSIDYALQSQKDVLNAELDVEISKAKVNETVGIGLPQLSASFDLKDFEKIPVSLIPAEFFGGKAGDFIPIQFGTRFNATAGVSASQLLFDPSYLVGVSASKTFRELSTKNLERVKEETAIAVTKAYYSILLLRERKKVIQANSDRLQKLFNDTKAIFENGFAEKIDLDRIEVANNNIQTETENFNRLMVISEKSLKFQMGLSENVELILTDSLDKDAIKTIQVPADKADPQKRIEYSILKIQQDLQGYNLKRYKAQYYPSLVAYGSLNTSAQRTEFNIFQSDYKWYPTGLIGATLNFTIFDGLQREAKIKQERLTLKKINNEIDNFEKGITFEVSSSRATLLDALSALNIQDKNLTLAGSVAKTSKIKYEQGVGSNLEVLDAETSLKESQVNYFNALYDAVLAKINLDKALGNFNY